MNRGGRQTRNNPTNKPFVSGGVISNFMGAQQQAAAPQQAAPQQLAPVQPVQKPVQQPKTVPAPVPAPLTSTVSYCKFIYSIFLCEKHQMRIIIQNVCIFKILKS